MAAKESESTEVAILFAAADIAEREHRAWKAKRGKKCAKNDTGPLARELRTMAMLKDKAIRT